MARTDTLPHFLTDLADSVREKTGETGSISASSLDTKVVEIPSGVDIDDYIIGTALTSYGNTFYSRNLIKKLPAITIGSSFTSLNSAFVAMNYLQSIESLTINTTATDATYMFQDCSSLTSLPLFDTSHIQTGKGMFQNCSSLTSVPAFNFSSLKSMYNMFKNCTNLIDVPVFDLHSVTNMNVPFSGCINLSNQSLNNILASCVSATSYKSTKTLNAIGISSEQATRCQSLSNYTAFVNAGWSTGY